MRRLWSCHNGGHVSKIVVSLAHESANLPHDPWGRDPDVLREVVAFPEGEGASHEHGAAAGCHVSGLSEIEVLVMETLRLEHERGDLPDSELIDMVDHARLIVPLTYKTGFAVNLSRNDMVMVRAWISEWMRERGGE